MDQIRQIILPVDDAEAAAAHYSEAFGLKVTFTDGAGWAALELGTLSLALAGPGEQPATDQIALGIKVTDLERAVRRMTDSGGTVLSDIQVGAHERRASVRDRFGTPLALYESLPDQA